MRLRLPSRRVWIGLGVLVGLGAVASEALGSRPEADERDAPVAPCPGTPNCARLRVPVAAAPPAVVNAIHQTLRDVPGAAQIVPTPTGALATFTTGPFTDDVAVEVERGSSGSVMWVRSTARLGRSDLGVNARRARRIVRTVAAWLPPGAIER